MYRVFLLVDGVNGYNINALVCDFRTCYVYVLWHTNIYGVIFMNISDRDWIIGDLMDYIHSKDYSRVCPRELDAALRMVTYKYRVDKNVDMDIHNNPVIRESRIVHNE